MVIETFCPKSNRVVMTFAGETQIWSVFSEVETGLELIAGPVVKSGDLP